MDFLIYVLVVNRGGSAYAANATGFCIGAMVNVVLIRAFVFSNSRFNLGLDVIITIIINGAMLGFGMAILWLQIEILSVNQYLAKIFANGLTFVLNYATRSIFFRRK